MQPAVCRGLGASPAAQGRRDAERPALPLRGGGGGGDCAAGNPAGKDTLVISVLNGLP
jgi:hypothetical protein